MVAESAEESRMIKAMAVSVAPEEYAARLAEAEAEKATWSALLPIFYYKEALFPGARLDLHLFEPRYRVMMRRVVDSTNTFAYVPNCTNQTARIGDVAVLAKIDECEVRVRGLFHSRLFIHVLTPSPYSCSSSLTAVL